MKYHEIHVSGILRTQNREYWSLNPHPSDNFESWLRDKDRVFYVVPRVTHLKKNWSELRNGLECFMMDSEIIYPYPRHIIVSADYTLEYLNDITIKVKSEGRTNSQEIKMQSDDMPYDHVTTMNLMFVEEK